jgi:CRP/FNR family transcriptional regulator
MSTSTHKTPLSSATSSTAVQIWRSFVGVLDSKLHPSGLELFQQDCIVQEVFLIESGVAKLIRSEDNGHELILGLRFPGALLGSAAAVCHSSHPGSAVTITDCRLTRIRKEVFVDLVASNAVVSLYLNEMLSREVLDQAIQVSQLAGVSARRRLEQLLWYFVPRQGTKEVPIVQRFQLPVRSWEAAQLLAVTPAYFSRLVGELESEGVLTRRKGWITIAKPDELWHTTPI